MNFGIPFYSLVTMLYLVYFKERVEAEEKEKEREKKDDALQTLKTTIIVSGVILAVAGAVIAITKKLREK